MKTFFQLREETTGKTLKVSKDIFEAAQQMMNEASINHHDWKAHHDQMIQKHISAGDHDSAELHQDAKDAHKQVSISGSKSDSKKAIQLSRKARNNDKKMGYSQTGAGLGPAGARVG